MLVSLWGLTRARLGRRALLALVAVGVATSGPVSAPHGVRAAVGRCGPQWSRAVQIGDLDGGLTEVSGFVSSARYPGIAWMIRDSDNPRSLYSFELDGDRPRWKEFPVAGVSNIDWEDVAYTVGPDGRGRLWILENAAETGPKIVYEVLEPDPSVDRSAELAATYRFEYPGDNLNTEAMFALDGHLVIVAKTSPNRVYRLPVPLSRRETNRAVDVGRLDVGSFLTAVSTSGDEALLAAVSTSDVVTVFERRGRSSGIAAFLGHDPTFNRSMPETQREAGDFFPYDSCDIVLVSEDATVWRLSNHGAPAVTDAAGPPTVLSVTAGDGQATVSWSPPAGEDAGDDPITGYRIAAYLGSAEAVSFTTPDGQATSAVVSGLTNGAAYTFTVAVIRPDGTGPESAASDPVTPEAAAVPPRRDAPAAPAPHGRSGYWIVEADGSVHAFGAARHLGATSGPGSRVVDLEATPSSEGYWIVDDGGRVRGYGDAPHLGDVDGGRLDPGETVTSLSRTPSGNGYWIFTTRGRVLPFGDAGAFGDAAQVVLNAPVLDSVATPTGSGYYMVAADGGVFSFGDASFRGSMGGVTLNAPVESLVPDPAGPGYWLVASDGGVFAFDAPFRGSMADVPLNRPVRGMVAFGNGYLMVAEDGGVFNFSDRPFAGSLGGRPPTQRIVSVAAMDA